MPFKPEDILKQATSLSQQFDKSFKSSVDSFATRADGFVKSAPTSLGQNLPTINDLAGKLGKLGSSISGSVNGALNQLGQIGSFTKFQDTFIPPSKLEDITPEEARLKGRQFIFKGDLTYPIDLANYFISFKFKEYERKIPLGEKKEFPVLTVNLPVPGNLSENFNMNYADAELGLLGMLDENIQKETVGKITSLGGADGAEATGKGLRETITDPTALGYAGRKVAGIVDAASGLNTTGVTQKLTGAVLNPFQTLLFQGTNLRSHTFEYRFSPRSKKETEILKKIINEFKKRMHPGKKGFLFTFPQVVDIEFGMGAEAEPYFFKTCFLESMGVNYAPSGIPAFFGNSADPVEINLSLTLKEITPLTSEDFGGSKNEVNIPYQGMKFDNENNNG
jgi:hypothetical protein